MRHCKTVHGLIGDKAALMREIDGQDVKPAIFDVEAVYVDDADDIDVKEEPQDEVISCDICDNTFPDLETLSEHKLSHSYSKHIKTEQPPNENPLKIKIKIRKKSKTAKLKHPKEVFENEAFIDENIDE